MSRAWMPWYIGDYLRDTGHLTTEQHGAYLLLLAHCWQHGGIPESQAERAATAKVTPRRWRVMSEPVNRFFNQDGTQKRVTQELEKAETVSIRRTLAGVNSAIARGAAKQIVSNRSANARANADQIGQQMVSKPPNKRPDNHNRKITKTTSVAEEPEQSAHSLASALPAGALAREPQTTPVAKRPSEMTRQELDAHYAAKRAAPDGLDIPPELRRAN